MAFGIQAWNAAGKLQFALTSKLARLYGIYTQAIPNPGQPGVVVYGGYMYIYTFTISIPAILTPSDWAVVDIPFVTSTGKYVLMQFVTINVGSITIRTGAGAYTGGGNTFRFAVIRVGNP